jgi:hypothetical protein
MSARDEALAEAVDQVLGGCGKLVAAIRARLAAPPPVAGKPDPGIWAEAADRTLRGER